MMVRLTFKARCPACCGGDIKTWYHYICGGLTQIDTSPSYGADLVCSKCSVRCDIVDWYFDCGKHDFRKATRQGAIYAISSII